jgi:sugar phosphate permease
VTIQFSETEKTRGPEISAPNARGVPQRRWARILPAALIMYTISYIDRTNISMALPSMSRELRMDTVQAGNVAGIFFWGYLLLQVPAGHIAGRWSAKRLISILLVAWGLCAIGCGLARTYEQIRIMRFLLGLAESGVWPATLVLVAHWFPRRERARANALWILCLPLAVVISSPFSGWILDHWNWRIMMIVEGAFPLIWLAVWQVLIEDHPRQAPWLSSRERSYLESALTRDNADVDNLASDSSFRVLFSEQILLLSLISFLRNVTDFGFLVWFPTILAGLRMFSNAMVGVLLAVPFLVGSIAMIVTSWHSDKSGERRIHMSVTFAIGGLALLLGVLLSHKSLTAAFLCFCLTGIGTYGYAGPLWSIPTETLPKKIVGPAMGFINGNANLGAFVGAITVGLVRRYTGGFVYGFAVLAIALLLASALCFCLNPAPLRQADL